MLPAKSFKRRTMTTPCRYFLMAGWLAATSLASAAGYRIHGYDVPVLDVSADKSRAVTVDRETGVYLGHPTTVLLPDGKTMFVIYPKGHAAGELVLKRSNDGGRTWSDRLPSPENWRTSKNPPSIHRLVAPDGRARLVVLTGSEENRKEDLPIRQAISEDDGVTWSALRPIGHGKNYSAIVVASSMVKLKDGRYMALHHSDYLAGPEGRKHMKLYKMLSSDGGLTWTERQLVSEHPVAQFCEPGAVRSPAGNEIAVLIRDNGRFQRGVSESFIIFSRDEGETWAPARAVPRTLAGDKHIGRYAPDGRLVIAFRDMDFNSPTRGHFIVWVGSYEDLVLGRSGQYRVKLLHNYAAMDCGYAGLELLPDGTFVATTYVLDRPHVRFRAGGDQHAVVAVRFQLEEFDRMLSNLR
jgi:hypothetical protein